MSEDELQYENGDHDEMEINSDDGDEEFITPKKVRIESWKFAWKKFHSTWNLT